mgnify:CR=1 FL=1
MKVGDLVIMPGSCYRDKSENPATGIILKTKRDGINRGFARRALSASGRAIVQSSPCSAWGGSVFSEGERRGG